MSEPSGSAEASAGQSVVYLALYDPRFAPGVSKKIIGTLKAADTAGYRTRSWSEPFKGWPPLLRASAEIIGARETHIIIRSLGWANVFVVPAMCIARIKGQVVIIDVPTPNRVAVHEIWSSQQSAWRRIRTVAWLYASGPWSFWPASRVLQYAEEGPWFRLGNRRKSVTIGNGVDVESTPQRRRTPEWPAGILRLIGVATLVSWHGYDRLIRAIGEFQSDRARPFDVHLTIVGDGPALEALIGLTQQLDLESHITFVGPLNGEELYVCYDRSHLAVSALAIHRKGLREASALKAREYCAVGIPFLASGDDADFGPDTPFRIAVSPDETTASLVKAFNDFGRVRALFSDDDIRRYAVGTLDFRHKLESIGLGPAHAPAALVK